MFYVLQSVEHFVEHFVDIHINSTKHITTVNINIPPGDSTTTHYKTVDKHIEPSLEPRITPSSSLHNSHRLKGGTLLEVVKDY